VLRFVIVMLEFKADLAGHVALGGHQSKGIVRVWVEVSSLPDSLPLTRSPGLYCQR
jgi:hypothetical protein